MKRIVFLLAVCIISFYSIAQIEMFDENIKKVEGPTVLPYDSLRNISAQKYGSKDNYKYTLHHLIGQTLLFCGDPDKDSQDEIFHKKSPFVKGDYYRVDSILPDDVSKGKYQRMLLTHLKSESRWRKGISLLRNTILNGLL